MTFAAQPQDHSQKVNRKMYRAALRSIMSELARQDRLVVVESLDLEAPKTKLLVKQLGEYGVDNVLIVSPKWVKTCTWRRATCTRLMCATSMASTRSA